MLHGKEGSNFSGRPGKMSVQVSDAREGEETIEQEAFHEVCMTRLRGPNRTNCVVKLK
jgi:hypothetical protein